MIENIEFNLLNGISAQAFDFPIQILQIYVFLQMQLKLLE
jgi:hypothetical protein